MYIGIICEFDPLHSGHARLLSHARAMGADAVICAMSGNFTQRGSFAALDKRARAEMAVRCGADLVVELPTVWAMSPAETFARGGVQLLALTGAQLTLPGVAGIILGIGMAVDANVVIFERIREEVKNGRPIGSAVRKGFSNALSAIIDSNVTTIIAAVVLYAFGTGSVRGFALTLGIGVATSLVTAVFVTHKLLDIFADLGIKNQKLYV